LLDACASLLGAIWLSIRRFSAQTFLNIPWRPSVVIPLFIAWSVVASLALRRR
jgi:hypothetical protein